MRIIPRLAVLFTSAAILLLSANAAYAEKRQTIRFYKLNSKDQPVRIIIREKTAAEAGCHNFIRGFRQKKIFRLTQIGFEYCSVYSDKNCAEGSEIQGLWGDETKASQLTQGGEWLFNYEEKKGVKMQSWACQ